MLTDLDKRYQNKIAKMTLEEKATLVGGSSIFGSAEMSKHHIPRLQFLDGGTGINFEQLFSDFATRFTEPEGENNIYNTEQLAEVRKKFYKPEQLDGELYPLYVLVKKMLDAWTGQPELAPGCYPPGILLGATFSPETVRKVGEALGMEAVAYHVDYLLGTPNVNIHRDPKNGRLFEGYSEDPRVVSTLAPELVKGVQSYPVIANVKHFAANNQETNRIGINEIITKRALYEIYLPGFCACVRAGVQSVMSAYNKINGVACTENAWLLTDVLRDEWGFEGLVMSDWGAVYNQVQAIHGGNDLNMPGPVNPQPVIEAVRRGALAESELDLAVNHILKVMDWLEDKKQVYEQNKTDRFSPEEFFRVGDVAAYEAAKEGIVLLKNQNKIFPVLPEDKRRVAVMGTGCERILTCGTGSAGVVTCRNTSFLKELSSLLGPKQVCMCSGQELSLAETCDTVLVVASLVGMEGNDRTDLLLSAPDRKLLESLIQNKKKAGYRIGLILNTCGPVDITEYEPDIDGIFCIFLPGMQGPRALANLICAVENPSGKLPVTFPKHDTDTPTYVNFPGEGAQVTYGEGIYVGYRYYDKKCVKPLYPFGYGLSYTSFEISNVTVNRKKFEDTVTLIGTITNTGSYPGAQVVQLYISDVESSVAKPVKELKKFHKLYLVPGEQKTFTFELDSEDFSYYDMDYEAFLCEEGYYDLIVATSSASADIVASVRVYKSGKSPYSYGLQSSVKVMFETPVLKAALLAWWQAENLDIGILYDTYQYSNSKKLQDIIPSKVDLNLATNEKLIKFMEDISNVVKP
ncbi:MAG: glycoside hydrolase family 3 N-terminal domain-containing protein [Eubacteriales bacterium]|nr:glycoside hydrolase family 3 N-terminal domain-containing protein [Eubacteriales bacterium]